MSWFGGRHDKIGIEPPIFGTFAKEGKGEREEGTHDENEDEDEGGREWAKEGRGAESAAELAGEGKVLGGPTKRVRQAWVTQTTDVDDGERHSASLPPPAQPAPLATTTKRTRKFGETCSTDRPSDRSLILVEQAHSNAAVSCSSE